jgi:hypothetical protein
LVAEVRIRTGQCRGFSKGWDEHLKTQGRQTKQCSSVQDRASGLYPNKRTRQKLPSQVKTKQHSPGGSLRFEIRLTTGVRRRKDGTQLGETRESEEDYGSVGRMYRLDRHCNLCLMRVIHIKPSPMVYAR